MGKKDKDHYRAATADEERVFNEQVREEFLRRILSEGVITRIQAVTEKEGGLLKLLVVANGITYAIRYTPVNGQVKEFTIEKQKPDKDCSIM
eukprot:UN03103